MRKILVGALVVGSVLATAFVGPAAQATARGASTSCDLSGTAKFKPGVTTSSAFHKVSLSGTLSGCSGGGVTSGGVAGKGKGTFSCTSGTLKATLMVTWNTAETSTVKITVDIGSGSFSGSVTAGKFVGEPVSGSLSVTPISGDCVFTPLTKAGLSGPISV